MLANARQSYRAVLLRQRIPLLIVGRGYRVVVPPALPVVDGASSDPRSFELRSSVSKLLAEHRQAALGFGLRRLVLQHIPVLGENAIRDAAHVRGDPGARPAGARE